jgi:hypothetical protein
MQWSHSDGLCFAVKSQSLRILHDDVSNVGRYRAYCSHAIIVFEQLIIFHLETLTFLRPLR